MMAVKQRPQPGMAALRHQKNGATARNGCATRHGGTAILGCDRFVVIFIVEY
jgi:hypothetical protein